MTRSFEITQGQSIDLSKIDLSSEEDQELKDVEKLVSSDPSCIHDFPFMTIEN